MNRVLVTGARGYIGRHCVELLRAQGEHVLAVSSQNVPQGPSGIEWHCADLRNPDQVERLITQTRPDAILHLAWYTQPPDYPESAENLRWLEGSTALVRLAAAAGTRRIVAAGTCAEYDWSHPVLSEATTPTNPATVYGVCKHALQLVMTDFAAHNGMSTAWGRVFFLYGPGEHPSKLVAYVIRSLLAGMPAECTTGLQLRDFIFVEDAAEAFVRLLLSSVEGPINIASGSAYAVRDVVMTAASLLEGEHLIRLGRRVANRNDPPELRADVTRLRDEVGWTARHDLRAGLAKTIAWWRHQQRYAVGQTVAF